MHNQKMLIAADRTIDFILTLSVIWVIIVISDCNQLVFSPQKAGEGRHNMDTFPFEFLMTWVRPSDEGSCMFCNQSVTHTMYCYVEFPGFGGLVDMDALWRKAIQKQMKGNYEPSYYRLLCDDCTQRFAAIQLGKTKPIRMLLDMASAAKIQASIELSLIIGCTVSSVNDEGDTWAMNAPNTTIEDVVRHIRMVKKAGIA